MAAVLARSAEYVPTAFVVGLPLNMDGTDSAQTRLTRRFADGLAARAGAPVFLQDERLSTFAADEVLTAAAIPPRRQRALRDALAAQAILRAFLEKEPPNDALPVAPQPTP